MSIFKRLSITIYIVMCMVMLTTIASTPVNASVEVQLDFVSRYIFRGSDLNEPNKPVLQPSLTYAFGDGGLALNVWGSFSFEDKESHETDVTLSYDFKPTENLSVSVGFIHYAWYFTKGFKFKDDTSHEVYVSVGLPMVFLNPTFSIYYDFDNGSGVYALLETSHSLTVADAFKMDLSASLGYNSKQWIEGAGLSDLNFGAAVPFKMDKVTISPYLNIHFILLDEVNEDDSEIVAGVSVIF
jgi:uncharacterized protein (TIGR02001 family)